MPNADAALGQDQCKARASPRDGAASSPPPQPPPPPARDSAPGALANGAKASARPALAGSGITMVDYAARLRDPAAEQQFESVDPHQLPPYAPPAPSQLRPGPAHRDTIPWYRDASDAPAQPQGAPRALGKTATQLQRSITPAQHVDQAWDSASGQPSATWAEPPAAPLPAPLRSALLWARDCPDYERWVVGQVN